MRVINFYVLKNEIAEYLRIMKARNLCGREEDAGEPTNFVRKHLRQNQRQYFVAATLRQTCHFSAF